MKLNINQTFFFEFFKNDFACGCGTLFIIGG